MDLLKKVFRQITKKIGEAFPVTIVTGFLLTIRISIMKTMLLPFDVVKGG